MMFQIFVWPYSISRFVVWLISKSEGYPWPQNQSGEHPRKTGTLKKALLRSGSMK